MNALKHLDETTVVLNGDILTDIDISALAGFHEKAGAAATIALHEVLDPSAYGLVISDEDGRVKSFVEKPEKAPKGGAWINAGIYVFSRKAVEMIKPKIKVSVERETFPAIIENTNRLFCRKQKQYWLDIGTIEKYRQANFDAVSGKFLAPFPDDKPIKRGVLVAKDAALSGAFINRPAVVGAGCKAGVKAKIKNSIIWDNVRIGKGAVIEGSIIGSFSIIGPGRKVINEVMGNGSRV